MLSWADPFLVRFQSIHSVTNLRPRALWDAPAGGSYLDCRMVPWDENVCPQALDKGKHPAGCFEVPGPEEEVGEVWLGICKRLRLRGCSVPVPNRSRIGGEDPFSSTGDFGTAALIG